MSLPDGAAASDREIKIGAHEPGGREKAAKREIMYFNPGCALSIYRPDKAGQVLDFLRRDLPGTEIKLHEICCRHDPQLPAGSVIINVCAGCDRRFGGDYEGISTISLWELLDRSGNFPFPDYHGLKVSVHDACPVRGRPAVHRAVRSLLGKMNIQVVEAAAHGTKSVCCGDSLYPSHSEEQIHAAMRRRADSMPCGDVVVYCVSCIKAMAVGGRTPRHLLDLLFGEDTPPQQCTVAEWHRQLEDYISRH